MAKFLLVFLILSSSELLLAQGRAILPIPEQKDTTPEDSKLETTITTNLPFVSDKKLFDMLSQICAKEMLLQLNAINKINKNTNDDKPNLIVCKALNAILPKRNHPLVRRAIEHEKIKVVLSGFGDMDVRTFVWMLRKLQWQNQSAKQMAEEVRRLINELYLLYEGKHKKPLSAKALAMQRMAMLYVQQRYGSNPKPIPVEDGPPSTAIKDREEFDRITSEAALRAEAEALEYKKNPRPKSESDRILEERFEMERQQKVARFSERTETEQ